MTAKDNGGFAFPTRKPEYVKRAVGVSLMPDGTSHTSYDDRLEPVDFPGMTLRDWFAGQTAAAITGGLVVAGAEGEKPAWVAEAAYALADAMIAERAK